MNLLYLTFPLIYYFTNTYLFIMLTIIDNLLISYNTISKIYNYELIPFYEEPYIDRYIYYVFISLLNPIFYLMLYTDITIILFLSTIPPIFSVILHQMNPLLATIKSFLHKIKKHIIYALIGYFLKILCHVTLKLDPCFTKEEIALLYKENYKEHVLLLIKNFILLTVMKAVSDGNTITLSIIKSLYNTKAVYQYHDPLPHVKENIEKIKTIILKRQFKLLFNPYVIDVIIKLYDREQPKEVIPKINQFVNEFELCTAKMFTVITLSKTWSYYYPIDFYFLVGMVSLTLSPFNKQNLIIKTIGTLVCYLSNSYYLGGMICEYTNLLFMAILIWSYDQFIKLYHHHIHIITHYNKYNTIIIINIAYLFLLSAYGDYDFKIVCMCYIIANAKYPLITSYFVVLGYLSNYHLCHLLFLGIILYLYVNLSRLKSAPLPKIPLMLIANYTPDIIDKNNVIDNKDNVVDNVIDNKKYNQDIKINTINEIIDYKPINVIRPIKHYDGRFNILNSMHNPKYIIQPI